jgi:CRP-like cAMP-binding protein
MPKLATPAFDVAAFLGMGVAKKREFRKKQTLFSQGEPAKEVFYIQEGSIKVAVTSAAGKEAVVVILGPGDFLGESCLVGQPLWIATATAMTPGSALVVEKASMLHLLHAEHEFSDRFISYMVTRNLRTEEDLIDQLFNSSEKRLARTLLLLASYGTQDQPQKVIPKGLSKRAGRDDRHHAHASQLFHEQVQETWVHRIQRRAQDQ